MTYETFIYNKKAREREKKKFFWRENYFLGLKAIYSGNQLKV